ncbi:cation:proton antiporter domain-containing protein [Nakamurella leprariae]|uniref:Cation:proton antiporter n=1 Tax=Nakamurella leprariae TaxID=2803911 RepID=A0A939C138_9ACTN|nr:cation:proton antiporter [Nakamurella leprariae]
MLTAIVPGIPFAAAVTLGAIVAPPDAVAAVAVARRVGLPRRLLTVLEGESLFNDATSLVTPEGGHRGDRRDLGRVGPAIGEFAWAAGGGVLLGLVLGLLLSFVLEGGVFALTGLELRGIVESLDTGIDNVGSTTSRCASGPRCGTGPTGTPPPATSPVGSRSTCSPTCNTTWTRRRCCWSPGPGPSTGTSVNCRPPTTRRGPTATVRPMRPIPPWTTGPRWTTGPSPLPAPRRAVRPGCGRGCGHGG